MMDSTLIEKRLAHIVDQVSQIRRLAKPESIANDPVQLGFVAYTLQTAIQAVIDVAAIVVTERKLGEPRSNREIFQLLASDGWIAEGDVEMWKRIIGFRNVVVHRYLHVDPTMVRAIVDDHLGDLLGFVASVRGRLSIGS